MPALRLRQAPMRQQRKQTSRRTPARFCVTMAQARGWGWGRALGLGRCNMGSYLNLRAISPSAHPRATSTLEAAKPHLQELRVLIIFCKGDIIILEIRVNCPVSGHSGAHCMLQVLPSIWIMYKEKPTSRCIHFDNVWTPGGMLLSAATSHSRASYHPRQVTPLSGVP